MDNTFYIWLYKLLSYIFRFYEISLIVYIFSSWFPMAKDNFIIKFLGDICEPYLGLFRKILPPIGMVDFSPILGILALGLIERLIYMLLFGGAFF